ncbi:TnsD family Tn7-like transposition protein, partial [Azospirillum argentinense]
SAAEPRLKPTRASRLGSDWRHDTDLNQAYPSRKTVRGTGTTSHPTPRRVVATTEFTNRLRDLVSQGKGLRATARALNVDTNTVRLHAARLSLDTSWRPLVRPRAAAKGDPAPAIRERWLDRQRQEPQLGRKALAHCLPAEHTWLYRHDRAWLDAHSPASASRTLPVARVDWAAADHDLATALREAAEAIVSLVPPVRVTLAELERRLGRPGWVGKRRAKLPETLAVLASNIESVEAFQLRRIAWAKALERSDGLAPAWKVHRLARLPTRVSAAVRQALATTPQNGPITPCR